jgi:hypothetical protein
METVATGRGIQLEKAYFHNEDTGADIPVMFNPTELSIKKAVPWNAQAKPKEDTPKLQFTAGQPRTMSIKLEFDTSVFQNSDGAEGAPNVAPFINPILELASVRVGSGDNARPPFLMFEWGSGLKFPCVIKSVNVTFTRFNPDGVPIKCNMQLELLEAKPDDLDAGASSSDATIVTADEGTTASGTVAGAGGDPADWRAIMEANESAFDDGNARSANPGASMTT